MSDEYIEYVDIMVYETLEVTGEAEGEYDPVVRLSPHCEVYAAADASASQKRWKRLFRQLSVIADDIYVNGGVKETEITIDLQPGESVTIDSERYYIWKNDENVTESHRGDWIDELNRGTRKISVSADASAISAQISYSERYL